MSSSCGIPPRPLRFVNGPRRGASPREFGIDPGGLHASLEAFSVKAEPGPDLCGLTAEPGLDLCGLKVEPAPESPTSAAVSSRRKILQMRQPAIDANAVLHWLLPGMRSSRGRRNSPSAAVSTFADQMPTQTGTTPWRANPAPIVNIK